MGRNCINFNCIPFERKFKILQDFLNTVFLIGDYLWSKFQQDETIFGRVRAQMNAESIQISKIKNTKIKTFGNFT